MVNDEKLFVQLAGCFDESELEWDLRTAEGGVGVRLVHRPSEREVESHDHATLERNKTVALLGMSFLLLNERSAAAAEDAN